LIDGLTTRHVPNEDIKTLGIRLDSNSQDYQPDFPLLILHGFADALACRGPDAKVSVGEVARIDLALLAFTARYAEVVKARDDLKHVETERAAMFGKVSAVLCKELGLDPVSCKPVWQRIMQRLRPWYEQESQRRQEGEIAGPTFDEVLAKAWEIYQGNLDRPAHGNR
jgi:hypothetical protein